MDYFKPIELDCKNKYRNLDISARGVVKGTKYFPVFLIDGEEYIFKPLSRTKPLATTLFSYAEVYWSFVINKYFDNQTPVCRLAHCKGLSLEQPKYYDKGVLVKSVTAKNQKLINLLEYFDRYPDELVDIHDYINYCMEFYDYKAILDSDFIKSNPNFGSKLAYQILLAILRQDYNYHYENINFIEENGKIVSVSSPIDFEFSCMFIFPDNELLQTKYYEDYLWQTRIRTKAQISMAEFFNNPDLISSCTLENVRKIVSEYPDTVENFLTNLERFIEDIDSIDLEDASDFIGPLNSDAWEIGHYTFKEDNKEKLQKAKQKVKLKEIDKDATFKRIKYQVKRSALELKKLLNIYLYAISCGVKDLSNFTLDDLYGLMQQNENDKSIELRSLLEK